MKVKFADVKNATKIKSNFDNKSTNYGSLKIEYTAEEDSDDEAEDAEDDDLDQLTLTKSDVVVFLPPTFFKQNFDEDKKQLSKIERALKSVGGEPGDTLFPQNKDNDIAFYFTFKTESEAEKAMQNDLGVKMILGSNFPLAEYDRDELPEKPDKNVTKKIFLNSMKDAKNLEKSGNYKDALEAYKHVYLNTVNNKLQTIGNIFLHLFHEKL